MPYLIYSTVYLLSFTILLYIDYVYNYQALLIVNVIKLT
jgi:hypothetical protein